MSETNTFEHTNTPFQIKNFFGVGPRKPLTTEEFKDFWASLTEDEKNYYRHADLG